MYQLKLFIAGHTLRSQRAIENLKYLFEEKLTNNYELVIIDVLKEPALAEAAKILATPTLIRELPSPVRRIIGDLSEHEKVLIGLEIQGDL